MVPAPPASRRHTTNRERRCFDIIWAHNGRSYKKLPGISDGIGDGAAGVWIRHGIQDNKTKKRVFLLALEAV
jgi:hypothetical protein